MPSPRALVEGTNHFKEDVAHPDNIYVLLDISVNSNCFKMTDFALEFLFSAMHVLFSVYVLD